MDAIALEDDPPSALAPLVAAVDASRPMLALPYDWDGEGSPGYDEATWRRSVDLLQGAALRLWEAGSLPIPVPMIRKGPRGSIDLHWQTPMRELLINIPADPNARPDYYGDDGSGGQPIKGTLGSEQDGDSLLRWLVVDDAVLLPPVHRQRMRLRIRSTRIGTPLPDNDV